MEFPFQFWLHIVQQERVRPLGDIQRACITAPKVQVAIRHARRRLEIWLQFFFGFMSALNLLGMMNCKGEKISSKKIRSRNGSGWMHLLKVAQRRLRPGLWARQIPWGKTPLRGFWHLIWYRAQPRTCSRCLQGPLGAAWRAVV